ncbi:MAG: hypothetical protein IIA87_05905 [Nanoarchaeota archaeon]|nr:hypothetical protein [Nanoarchaeota archaeon]
MTLIFAIATLALFAIQDVSASHDYYRGGFYDDYRGYGGSYDGYRGDGYGGYGGSYDGYRGDGYGGYGGYGGYSKTYYKRTTYDHYGKTTVIQRDSPSRTYYSRSSTNYRDYYPRYNNRAYDYWSYGPRYSSYSYPNYNRGYYGSGYSSYYPASRGYSYRY